MRTYRITIIGTNAANPERERTATKDVQAESFDAARTLVTQPRVVFHAGASGILVDANLRLHSIAEIGGAAAAY